jgi:hypothetical protein
LIGRQRRPGLLIQAQELDHVAKVLREDEFVAAGQDRDRSRAKATQLRQSVRVFKHVDGLEPGRTDREKLLEFQAARSSRLPEHLQRNAGLHGRFPFHWLNQYVIAPPRSIRSRVAPAASPEPPDGACEQVAWPGRDDRFTTAMVNGRVVGATKTREGFRLVPRPFDSRRYVDRQWIVGGHVNMIGKAGNDCLRSVRGVIAVEDIGQNLRETHKHWKFRYCL